MDYFKIKNAVDGDKSRDMSEGAKCTMTLHTNNLSGMRWQMDLEKSFNITKVVIYGRTDCCKEDTIGTKILILEVSELKWELFLIGSIDAVRDDAIYTFDCDIREGRFVRIVNENIGYLALCEVEVWGE